MKRGFKVVQVRDGRKVQRIFYICDGFLHMKTVFEENGRRMEVYECAKSPVEMFRDVHVKQKNIRASTTRDGIFTRKTGVYIDGENLGKHLLFGTHESIRIFLEGKDVYTVDIIPYTSIKIVPFPFGRIKTVQIDRFLSLGIEILGESSMLKILREIMKGRVMKN
ncbi:MAG: hypothetical protein DRP30_03560 [Thermotoga sp.]|nr:MAG: hypothetical protein DRP30_03560 [Thermotoga sp.]